MSKREILFSAFSSSVGKHSQKLCYSFAVFVDRFSLFQSHPPVFKQTKERNVCGRFVTKERSDFDMAIYHRREEELIEKTIITEQKESFATIWKGERNNQKSDRKSDRKEWAKVLRTQEAVCYESHREDIAKEWL